MILRAEMCMPPESQRNKKNPDWLKSSIYILTAWIAALLLIGSYRYIAWPRETLHSFILGILPVPEVMLLFSLLILLRVRTVSRLRWAPCAFYLGLLLLWNVGEIVYRWNYREHFSLFDDLYLLPGLLSMLSSTAWFNTVPGMVIIYILVTILTILIGMLLIKLIARGALILQDVRLYRQTGIFLLLLALVQAAFYSRETPTFLLLSLPKKPEIVEYPQFSREEIESARIAYETIEERHEYSYPGIADGDVHLLVAESYGHTLFTNPVHKKNIAPVFEELSQKLDDLGWTVRSGFLDSPAFGGRSWLADATLITGLRMVNQQIFNNHIYSAQPNLSGQMGAAGYHTVYAAPGTRQTPEDWKAYYGYDEYLIEGDFGWMGPFISFGRMSDQYLLDFIGRRYSDSVSPVFLTALLVSSHVPFVQIPEYIDDWEDIGDGSIYKSGHIRQFRNNWLGGSEYPEGYVYSINYVLRSILGYIERYVDDEALVVIVGDHQPRTPISENTATSGVPLHFLSRSKALDTLDGDFFSQGFIPQDDLPLQAMEDFPRILKKVLQPAGALAG